MTLGHIRREEKLAPRVGGSAGATQSVLRHLRCDCVCALLLSFSAISVVNKPPFLPPLRSPLAPATPDRVCACLSGAYFLY